MSADLTTSSRQTLAKSPAESFPLRAFSAFACCALSLLSKSSALPELLREGWSDGHKRPSRDQVLDVCAQLESLDDANARALLRRGFTLEELVELHAEGLVGHLSAERCPSWLSDRGGMVLPLTNAWGSTTSAKPHKYAARKTEENYSTVKGLVPANGAARLMLAGLLRPAFVVMVEGESDFWRAVLLAPVNVAVIGLFKGAWTELLASRIPTNCPVVLRFDPDDAGERYAQKVGETLALRCPLLKATPDPLGRDLNDLWRDDALPEDLREGCEPFTPALDHEPRPSLPTPSENIARCAAELSPERKTRLRELLERDLEELLASYGRHDATLRIGTQLGRRLEVGIVTASDLGAWLDRLLSLCSADSRGKTLREKQRDTRRAFADAINHGKKRPYLPQTFTPAPRPKAAPRPLQAQDVIDRDRWPSHLLELAQNGARIRAIHRMFLKPEDLSGPEVEAARAIFIKSTQGTGKTELMRWLAATLREQCKPVLYVTHRRLLCGQSSYRLELADYRHCKDVSHAQRLSICLNSITKISLTEQSIEWIDEHGQRQARAFGLVIIDESEQVARALFNKTIGNASPRVYAHLRAILQCAKQVLCADADLGPLTLRLVRRCLGLHDQGSPAELHLHNSWYPPNRRFELFENRDHLLRCALERTMHEDFGTHGPMLLACTFKRDVETLHKIFTGQTLPEGPPEDGSDLDHGEPLLNAPPSDLVARVHQHHQKRPLRVLTITSLTTLEGDARDFLDAPERFARRYDLILYSPSLGTGFDISFPTDSIWGFFGAGTHTSHDVMQMLARGRRPHDQAVRLWIQERNGERSTDPEQYKRDALARIAQGFAALYPDSELRPAITNGAVSYLPNDADHFDLWALVQAEFARTANNLRASVIDWIKDHGARWDWIEDDHDHDLKRHRKIAKDVSEEEEIDLVDAVELIDDAARQELEARGAETTEEHAQLRKARLARHLDHEPSRDDITADVKDNLQPKTLKLAYLLAFARGMRACFEQDFHTRLQSRSRVILSRNRFAEARAFHAVLSKVGFDFNNPRGFTFEHRALLDSDFIPWVRENQSWLSAHMTIPKDLESRPADFLRITLSNLGLTPTKTRKGKRQQQVRRYEVTAETAALAMRWATPTLQRLARATSPTPALPPESPPAPYADPDTLQAIVHDHLPNTPPTSPHMLACTQHRLTQHRHPQLLAWWAQASTRERMALAHLTRSGELPHRVCVPF